MRLMLPLPAGRVGESSGGVPSADGDAGATEVAEGEDRERSRGSKERCADSLVAADIAAANEALRRF